MNNRPSLYRSTLITAAVAIGCFGAVVAQVHDQGWCDHDRGWHEHDRGGRDWRDHDRYRGYGPRYGRGEAGWYGGWAAPPVAYDPAPPLAYGPGGVSVVVRLPF